MNAIAKHEPQDGPVHLPAITPLGMIERAIEKGADVTMIEKLMELQERNERNIGRRAFDQALAAAKAEFKPIRKSGKVSHGQGKTAFEHETLADIEAAISAPLARYGLHYRFRTQQTDRICVTCIIAHKDGHSEEVMLTGAPDTSGAKNSIQAVGSTTTYLQRYTLKAALGLAAAADDDGEQADQRQGNENITADQWQELSRLIEDAGIGEDVVLTAEKIAALDFLPARRFDGLKAKLQKTIAARKGGQ
ncbi:ERF family protein [Frigidibacter sp. MR17.24]|uniref:ERF family protein n=1 Tax=Frigidibacter sp. MR17.24 TaxID=3127345 RepID=UPI00301308CA